MPLGTLPECPVPLDVLDERTTEHQAIEDKTMSGRRAFQQLRNRLSPDAQREAAALTDAMGQELSLAELRRARAMTQEQLASDLHVGQASITKLERRTDMYLSTLRRFVEAMGG